LEFLPTRWSQKTAGIDVEQNDVTVALCVTWKTFVGSLEIRSEVVGTRLAAVKLGDRKIAYSPTCNTDITYSRVGSVLDSGAVGPGFKSQSRRCRVTVLGKLFTPTVPLFTKQRNW